MLSGVLDAIFWEHNPQHGGWGNVRMNQCFYFIAFWRIFQSLRFFLHFCFSCFILESEFLAKPAVIKNTAVFLFLIGERNWAESGSILPFLALIVAEFLLQKVPLLSHRHLKRLIITSLFEPF